MPTTNRKYHTVFISLGSNMGDKLENCRHAVAALSALDLTRVVACSPFYKTEPVDYTDQDWFINAVVKVETELTPQDLLARLKEIQQNAGRTHDTVRFGPRIIDLDILFYDDRVIRTAGLEVPHPRMHKRRFVLQPICDIEPHILHPILKTTVEHLLEQLDDDAQSVELYRCV
jgi:2-amino-4-hydroxy-6-hydroxymethyldihydropteridine diphosphokinase